MGAIEWGDVPNWLQGIGGAAQLGQVVWSLQSERAGRLVAKVQDSAALDDNEISRRIATRPELAAVMLQALEEAMRSRTDDQLELLSRIAAAALDGEDARLDASAMYLRTAGSLEPAHMRVLVAIADPDPSLYSDMRLVGARRMEDLEDQLDEDQRALFPPILSALTREGLVEDVAVGTVGYKPAWRATAYAFEFLMFLPSPPAAWRQATLAAVAHSSGLLVRNLGMLDAELTAVEATSDGRSLCRPLPDTLEIRAGESVRLPLDTDLLDSQVARIPVDLGGRHRAGQIGGAHADGSQHRQGLTLWILRVGNWACGGSSLRPWRISAGGRRRRRLAACSEELEASLLRSALGLRVMPPRPAGTLLETLDSR